MKLFDRARLKLTLYYALTISVVSIVFGTVIYQYQIGELQRFELAQRTRIERRLEQGMGIYQMGMGGNFIIIDQELLDLTRQRILFRIIGMGSIVIFLSTIMGYILAGYTLRPIEDMVEAQGRFVGDASHELRTPLTALRTTLEVYQRDKASTKTQADTLIADNLLEVKRLQKLSDSLLRLSSSQGISLDQNLDLKKIVQKSIDLFRSLALQKHVKLTSRLSSVSVKGDEDALHELATIMIDNAIKYTNEKDGKVLVKLSKIGRRAVLTVSDNGIGIDKKDLPHIFDRFYRADSSRSTGGNGLGLAIASRIVKSHRGKITVNTKVGRGTTFTIELPSYS